MECDIGSHYQCLTSTRESTICRGGTNQSRTAKILAQAQLTTYNFPNMRSRKGSLSLTNINCVKYNIIIRVMEDGRLRPGRYISCDGAMNGPALANDAAPSPMTRVTITRNTAPPSGMRGPRNTLTHQHARPSCGLK